MKSIFTFILLMFMLSISYGATTIKGLLVDNQGIGIGTTGNLLQVHCVSGCGGGGSFPDITDIGGNVGIGSTNPGYPLDIQGSLRIIGNSDVGNNILVQDKSTIGEGIVQVKNDLGHSVYMAANGSAVGGASSGALAIGVTSGESLELGDSNNGNMMTVVGGNVGVGSVNPIAPLDVQGSVRIASTISTATWLDPTVIPNADGSIAAGTNNVTTTTGTNNSGQNLLTVASVSGWAIGNGIAVANAGTGGNTELISYVTAINGLTFTLNDNLVSTITTGQSIHHDDTRALTDALNTNLNVHLRSGTFNVTSAITPNGTFMLQGDGTSELLGGAQITGLNPTVINNRGTTNNVLDLCVNGATIGSPQIYNISIQQSSAVTPTAGYGFIVCGPASHIHGLVFADSSINNTFGGISVGNGATSGNLNSSTFRSIYIRHRGNSTGSIGVFIDNVSPNGDNDFIDIYVASRSTSGIGWEITASDTTYYTDDKAGTEDTGVLINDSNASTFNQRFVNFSCENASGVSGNVGCITIKSTTLNDVYGISFIGGESYVPTSAESGIDVDSNVENVAINNFTISGAGASLSNGFRIASANNVTITQPNCYNIPVCVALSSTKPTNVQVISPNCASGVTSCITNTGNVTSVIADQAFNGQVNVGIGTWPARSMLDVNGTIASTSLMDVWGTLGQSFYIQSSGNVGVGSPNPVALLDVNGSIRSFSGGSNGTGACWCTNPSKVIGNCTGTLGTCTQCNYGGVAC